MKNLPITQNTQDNSVVDITINTMPSVRNQDDEHPWKLSEIIEQFSTSEELENLVSRVREASTKEERKSRKESLPVTRPCTYKGNATGIIQFDFDDHDINKSIRLKELLIKNVPSLLYAFISPSGGLKYGVWTDYTDNPENFSTAYSHTKKLLQNAGVIKETDNYDDRMKSITYLCYFSYDPDAYFNPVPETMRIFDEVQEIVKQKKESSTITTPANIPTTDEDKIVFLEAIDAIAGNLLIDHFHHSDRVKIAQAVVNEFGLTDGTHLVFNTLRFFSGKTDYLNGIIQKSNNLSGATILHYARQCGFKGITPSFKKNNTAGDTERAHPIPKDTTRLKRYSVKEATALIEKRVDQFLKDRINVQLIVEMGVGKTQITLKKLIEHMDNREEDNAEPLRIAVFVPSHKLGHESLTKLLNFEDNQIVGDFNNDGLSLGSKRFHKVIGGYGVHCEKLKHIPEEDRKGMTRNAYECDTCEHKETHCWYIYQFFHNDDLIRIYPSNYLYTPSNFDRDYKPDLIVVDEDISDRAIIDRGYGKSDSNIWKRILTEGFDTLEPSDITQAKRSLKMRIKSTKSKLKNGNSGSLVKVLTSLYAELEDLKIMLSGEGVVAKYNGKVHICHKNSIHKKWLDVPMLYLNGTGNEEMSDAIFGDDNFDVTEEIRVEYNPNVTVYQLQNKSFNRDQVEEKEQELFDLISYFYHYDNSCFISYGDFIEKCLKQNPEYDSKRFMYFGNTRGQSDFEDNNIIIIIGRHYLPHQALAMKGQVLFGCNDIYDDRHVCTRAIEMKDSDYDAEIGCRDFTDERMRLLGRYYNEGEVLQSIHRLRLIHGTEQKTVIYLSNHLLDGLQVDKFLIADDVLFNDKKLKNRKILVSAVQEHGTIEGKPRLIAEASGLTAKEVSNLKNKAWFKDNIFFYLDEKKRLIDRYSKGNNPKE